MLWDISLLRIGEHTTGSICANAERGSRRTVFVQSVGMKML